MIQNQAPPSIESMSINIQSQIHREYLTSHDAMTGFIGEPGHNHSCLTVAWIGALLSEAMLVAATACQRTAHEAQSAALAELSDVLRKHFPELPGARVIEAEMPGAYAAGGR